MKRINKFLTDAGYCSRREADRYVEQGRVMVNGRRAVIGQTVSDEDRVEVDGKLVGQKKKKRIYIMLNKPVGVTCTTDPKDRTNIADYIGHTERIFPVGRLDKDSEGLIILTNDGDIVNKILRAGNNNPKEYIVTVDKPITDSFLRQMASGVHILGVKTKPCKIERKSDMVFVLQLTQGLNRQIRRMCEALGYCVIKLKRVRVMNLTLGTLDYGRWRYLTQAETDELHALLAKSSGTEEASNEQKAQRKAPLSEIPKPRLGAPKRRLSQDLHDSQSSRSSRDARGSRDSQSSHGSGASQGSHGKNRRPEAGKHSAAGKYSSTDRRSAAGKGDSRTTAKPTNPRSKKR